MGLSGGYNKEPQPVAPAGGLSQNAVAKGEVQKAMGQNLTIDGIWDDLKQISGVREEFGDLMDSFDFEAEKVVAVKTLIPLLAAKWDRNQDGLARRRAGVLNGYRDYAEKNGLMWRKYTADLESRGLDVWERERANVIDATLAIPDYYVYGGQGPLHSYARGNCNWEAAFDAKPAFELVHMHHFPQLSPEACMAELHQRLDNAALSALQCPGPVAQVIDVGCGVGTSTFSFRESLDRLGMTKAKVTAVDLSSHFITVANYRQAHGDQSHHGWDSDLLKFVHGDGLQLRRAGFEDESVEVVVMGKVSHEAPAHANYMLMREAARVLRPGGVVGYVDINPQQILKTNPVSNLVERVAIRNEPFFDEFIALDMHDVFQQAGLEVVCEVASNPDKWPEISDAPVRVMVARKPL